MQRVALYESLVSQHDGGSIDIYDGSLFDSFMEPLLMATDEYDSLDANSHAPDLGARLDTKVPHLGQFLRSSQAPGGSFDLSYLDHSALSPGSANMFDGVPVQNS